MYLLFDQFEKEEVLNLFYIFVYLYVLSGVLSRMA